MVNWENPNSITTSSKNQIEQLPIQIKIIRYFL